MRDQLDRPGRSVPNDIAFHAIAQVWMQRQRLKARCVDKFDAICCRRATLTALLESASACIIELGTKSQRTLNPGRPMHEMIAETVFRKEDGVQGG